MKDQEFHNEFTGDEIAIVGMACRFPGASNLQEFWTNLTRGEESISFFTKAELKAQGLSDDVLDAPNYIKAKGQLEGFDRFEPEFFGFSTREAKLMDPQLRLLFETVWHALEDAGVVPENESGQMGIFTGADLNLAWISQFLTGSKSPAELYALSNLNDPGTYAAAIAYRLKLTGPAITLHTACSTSLVAIHTAAKAILNGECDTAIAGGVSISLPAKSGYSHQEGMIFSPDGHCRAFDERAKGTVNGDGAGIVVLKPYEDALRDGNHIYAVIRESVVNNDGDRKIGYTAPSVPGQAEAIRTSHLAAEIDAESISYVEAHGTGTTLGDPIEIEALKRAFQSEKKQFCGIGSVKSNIGHLDAAAGVAGLIKLALSLNHKQLPPSLHFHRGNPEINFPDTPFFVQSQLADWNPDSLPRRAGLSSFGIGGTNAHAILEEAPPASRTESTTEAQAFLFSAHSEAQLLEMLASFRSHLLEKPDLRLSDVARTLATGRRHFPIRVSLLASDRRDLLLQLNSLSGKLKPKEANGNRKVAFVFPGQGAQFGGMFDKWMAESAHFRGKVESCLRILAWPSSRLSLQGAENHTRDVQPAVFIFQYALASCLMDWGIKADLMLGHSLGELSAACLSGLMSLEDALRMVVKRGELMAEMEEGRMLAVKLSVEELIRLLPPDLEISTVNTEKQCVVSGKVEAVESFRSALEGRGIACKLLSAQHAFHSAATEPILEAFGAAAAQVKFQEGQETFVSGLTGKQAGLAEVGNADYWTAQIRKPVQFAEALNTLLESPDALVIEIGPGDGLRPFVRRHNAWQTGHAYLSLKEGSRSGFLKGHLGELWAMGLKWDWEMAMGNGNAKLVSLPGYPFDSRSFWPATGPLALQAAPSGLKESPSDWTYEPVWKKAFAPPIPSTTSKQSWLIIGDPAKLEPLAEHLRLGGHQVSFASEIQPFDKLPDRIVHALNLGSATEETAFHSLIELTKAIASHDREVRLDVLATSLFSVRADEISDPLKALLLGPAAIVPVEYKTLKVHAIDVGSLDAGFEDALVPALLSSELPQAIALREGAVWERKWQLRPRGDVKEPNAHRIKKGGVYLITGGRNGIGREIASYLSREYELRLVLISRSAFEPPKDLRGEVMTLEADVTKRDELAKALEEVRQAWGGIDGVFHCAGIPDGGLLPFRERSLSERVLAPKVTGTLLLDELLANDPPDFCLLFSSMNNLLPIPGQVAYNAANSFLDAFAESADPTKGYVSILWDRWEGVGMAQLGMERKIEHAVWDTCEAKQEGEWIFRGSLDSARDWILFEHSWQDNGLLPGTAQLDLVCGAFREIEAQGPISLENIVFLAPLVVPIGELASLSLSISASGKGHAFQLRSESHAVLCKGNIGVAEGESVPNKDVDVLMQACSVGRIESPEGKGPEEGEIKYGSRWQNFRNIALGRDELVSQLELQAELQPEVEAHELHPGLVDTAFMSFPLGKAHREFVPFACRRILVLHPLKHRIYSHLRQKTPNSPPMASFDLDISIFGMNGTPLVEVEGLQFIRPEMEADADRPAENFKLKIARPGDLDSFELVPLAESKLKPMEVEVQMEVVGLNFKDLLTGFGLVTGKDSFGYEGVGKVLAVGAEVKDIEVGQTVTVATHPVMQGRLRVSEEFVFPISEELDQEVVAASVVAYATAWHALVKLGKVEAGESVLIHSAAGGLGSAAITIAKKLGAVIYATAGNEEKREWLREQGVRLAMDSRSDAFVGEVLQATDGKGVNFVLNSLSGDLMERTFDALAPMGRFVEVGVRDIQANRPLPMACFEKGVAYFALGESALPNPRTTTEMVLSMLEAGELQPLRMERFPISRVGEAFQKMAAAEHIGKLLVDLRGAKGPRKVAKKSLADSLPAAKGMTVEEGLGVMKRIMASPAPCVAVSISDLHILQSQKPTWTHVSGASAKDSPKKLEAKALPPGATLESVILQMMAEFFGVPDISPDDNIFELGASSLDVLQIGTGLAERLGIEVSPTLLFNHPTVRLLASHLGKEEKSEEEPSVREKKVSQQADRRKARMKRRKSGSNHGKDQ